MSSARYRPESDLKLGIEACSARFEALIKPDAQITRLWADGEWVEGPAYLPAIDSVVWSDIPNMRIMRYDIQTSAVAEFDAPPAFTNGNTVDAEGRLLSCDQGARCIKRREADGSWTVLADAYGGRRLNSPNDIVVKRDGTIWFTDPPYGIIDPTQGYPAEAELDGCYVFMFNPADGELRVVSDELDRPNGLAFSPDERVLYVSDTGANSNVVAFDVTADNRLAARRDFIKPAPGKADGMRVDRFGNVFSSAWDGIQVFDSAGELLGKILIPEQRTSNCQFGGAARDVLYITSTSALYRVQTETSAPKS